MNWSKRKGTTGKIVLSPQFLAEEKFTFQRVISSYASPGQYIFSFKGSKIVPIISVDDKRQITATFAVSLTQIFLRIQLIYTGTTPQSLPKYDFSVSFFVVFTDADKSIVFVFFNEIIVFLFISIRVNWVEAQYALDFPNLSLKLCLTVSLISKLISWCDIAFDMNTAMVSLIFEIL